MSIQSQLLDTMNSIGNAAFATAAAKEYKNKKNELAEIEGIRGENSALATKVGMELSNDPKRQGRFLSKEVQDRANELVEEQNKVSLAQREAYKARREQLRKNGASSTDLDNLDKYYEQQRNTNQTQLEKRLQQLTRSSKGGK